MAASVNKVFILGNLGADPEMSHSQAGQAVTRFRVATNETWTAQDGSRMTRTEWHRVVVFGKLAETCHQYLRKGRIVFVEGKIRTRRWEDREGQVRFVTEIVAQNVQFVGGPQMREEGIPPEVETPEAVDSPSTETDTPPLEDEDVPF